MEVTHQRNEIEPLLKAVRKNAKSIGFVPTMGALHEGHLSLIRKSQTYCDYVVVSIFVNPTQFDNSSDLDKYPRTLDKDLKILNESFENLIIFAPSVKEIYGEGLNSKHFEFGALAKKMEGASRNGHFDGVGTILEILFDIIKPDQAFFGEKDYQQLLIVKKLVKILNLPIEIIGCPIDREENGLARSSRNKRLNKEQLKKADFIYKSLLKAKNLFNRKDVEQILKEIRDDYKNNPDFQLDYFEIADAENLEPAESIEREKKYRAFVAARMGEVRLIDNMLLN